MKQINIYNIIIALLFSVVCNTTSFGQSTTAKDSVYSLTFEENQSRYLYFSDDQIPWLYHNGTHSDWAQPTIDLEGWTNVNPQDLDETYADENGNIEGWFRVKIKLDDSWKNQPLRLRYNFMAAAEVFVDGKLFGTYGNLGSNNQEFRFFSENNPSSRINLTLNETHTIAIHIKDKLIYPTQISGSMIGLQTGWSKPFFLILQTDNEHYEALLNKSSRTIYFTLWPAINFIIGFLFLFLYILNKKEKNLLLYTGVCVGLGINILSIYLFNFAGYNDFQPIILLYLSLVTKLTYSLIFILLFFSIIKIFDIKLKGLNRLLYVTFLILIIAYIVSSFIGLYTNNYDDIVSIIALANPLVFILILIYWTIISFRHSSLPQKVIAYGIILFFLLCIIFIIAANVLNMSTGSTTSYNLITAIYFCFPISLLTYVVLRFQEINKNIVLNSEQILKLSEEKRVMAEGQQKLLEVQVTERTQDLQKSLSDLKATQNQLVQSEKLASLGQLAAGIAHEIKNPLNFVNNFSELNLELIDEITEELEKLPESPEKIEIKAILEDVVSNQKKIHQHGSRADSIVKSMLLHSRGGNGIKEPTNINEMLKEYVNLSFHGMRAGKKPINVSLDFQLDDTIPNISVIMEDVSRVILNLCNNAFDAMHERLQKKTDSDAYQPKLTVKTYGENKQVVIEITDNALGISNELQNKILMPFFTTKKGTEGTGLGLSITNDIIEAHGGSLNIESKQGEDSFTTFRINLTT